MSASSPPEKPDEAGAPEPDAEEIDSGWDEASPEPVVERPSRDRMATLHDEDPLRHDIGYRRERDPTRDSRPTLPVINPLQYDEEVESERAGGGDSSGVRRRMR